MSASKAETILKEVRRSEPDKKRYTFFLSVDAKAALAEWCNKNGVSESGAIDAMIKATVPSKYFKGTNAAERRATKSRSLYRESTGKGR